MPRRPAADAPENALAAVLIRRKGRPRPRAPRLTVVDVDTSVARQDRPPATVLFPVTALFGLVSVLPDGPEVEVATIGWEGVVGHPTAVGDGATGSRILCHIPGRALQLPVHALLEQLGADPAVNAVFEHYGAMTAALLGTRAACGQRHAAAGRYATWLLQCADRFGPGAPVPLTQQLLALILGLQRTTVSSIAARLEDRGLTRSRYGAVQILDRPGLERAACACYLRFRGQVDDLLDHAFAVAG